MTNPPLAKAIEMAQNYADKERQTYAVLNLNPYAGLYVVREWHGAYANSHELVRKVEPR